MDQALERAKFLEMANALPDYCDWLRETSGIPIGLWAVATSRISPNMLAQALLAGHTELLGLMHEEEPVPESVREEFAFLIATAPPRLRDVGTIHQRA